MYGAGQCIMKLTVNLDEEVLNKVVEITGSTTKTEAIMKALKEVERRSRLVSVLREGLGASEEELKSMFDPASDVPERRSVSYGSGGSDGSGGADAVSMVAEKD